MAAEREYSSFLRALQDEAEQDVLKAMIRVVIRELMQEEVGQHLRAEPYERTGSRTGYRNGHKPRTLNTRLGKLEFEVPQVRGTDPYRPMFFERWQRSERALLVTCAEMYFMGVSTRKVGRILEEMGGFSLSAATVSKVAAELDEKIEEFRSRTLGDQTWPFLIVDARYEKVRHAGRIVSRAVLVVAGVNDDGHREILTWRLGDSESEQTWAEVFGELRRRGLSGVELVVSDGHEGIRAALQRAFPQAAWQRCRIHFIRNIMSKCSHKDRIVLINDIRAAFKLTDRSLALETARELAVRWRGKYAKVAKQLEEQFEECLAVMEFPTRHRRRLHSTNMLERLMREIKRRTRVVGIFPNEASCDRLVGAMLIEYHELWQGQRARFIRMEEF
jgi:putative transposase